VEKDKNSVMINTLPIQYEENVQVSDINRKFYFAFSINCIEFEVHVIYFRYKKDRKYTG
jgi:hypothetical protein